LREEHQSLSAHPDKNPLLTRQVLRDEVALKEEVYEQYIQYLFSNLRCGWENAEMILKLYGHFMGAEWSEASSLLGGVMEAVSENLPLLRCKIEPLYATVQSILPPFEGKRKKRWDVQTWKPKDPMNYQIVWHLMVTLSNGEKHKMYYPICSLRPWQQTMQHYFDTHPTELFSLPNYTCSVTNHAESYPYEEIREHLKFFEDQTVGVYPAEILLKLSAFFYDPNRATYLQTVLTGNAVELVFSGKVLWS
jgi:hypothetical protein